MPSALQNRARSFRPYHLLGTPSMKILIYEYLTGGGLWSDQLAPRQHPLLAEGRGMMQAVGHDVARINGVQTVHLLDARLHGTCDVPGDIIAVHSQQEELQQLAGWSREVDGVILIAPESDGRLLHRCELVAQSGGQLFSPHVSLVQLATDKCATAQQLALHDVPTPPAQLLNGMRDSVAELPGDFPYPAVLKPVDGVGALDTYVVQHARDWPAAAPVDRPWRLEQYISGTAVSVAMLCGPRGVQLLPPCYQHVACDGHIRYLGGTYPLATPLVSRACRLARCAFAALPRTVGYVGIDMILADEGSAIGDCVLDVNPRLTTSYVGLRQATAMNLADAMLGIARGECRPLFFRPDRVQFDAEGCIISDSFTAAASP